MASLVVAWLWGSVASATPIVDDTSVGPIKWDVAVNVYIPRDPTRNDPDPSKRRNRHEKVKKAVEEWVAASAGTGLTINPIVLDENGKDPGTGQPPDPNAAGSVIVEWTDTISTPGFTTWSLTGEPTGRKNSAGKDILRNQKFVSVKIQLKKGITASKAVDEKKALAVGLHEMGHALGVDHTRKTDSVMQATLEMYLEKIKPGASDKRELGAIYANSNTRMEGAVVPLPNDLFRYSYSVDWLSGGELPLVQLVTLGAPIEDLDIPLGWEFVEFPFTEFPNVFSLRVAPTDDLQAYLNADNPLLEFSFTSLGSPWNILGWSGALSELPGPRPIPEPATVLLLGSGLLGLGALARGRGRRK